jgi:hypothetical protein
LAPSVEPAGFFVAETSLSRGLQLIDPFMVVAMAVGFAIVASLMLTAIEQ